MLPIPASQKLGNSKGTALCIRAQFKPSKRVFLHLYPSNVSNQSSGSFTNSPLVKSLAWKLTIGPFGNLRLCDTTLANVSSFPEPFKVFLLYNNFARRMILRGLILFSTWSLFNHTVLPIKNHSFSVSSNLIVSTPYF